MTAGDRPARAPISDGLFYILAALCGALTGVVGAAFHLVVDTLTVWPSWVVARFGHGIGAVLLAAAIASVALVLAFVLTRRIAPEAAGSGVQEIEGAMEGLRKVRWRRVLPVKFVAGVLSLSTGLVAGREGPTIHMGASIAEAIAERLKFQTTELRGLLAAGAAAGLAAAFNAPLAAILFIIEETRKQFAYTFRAYTAVIIASVSSAIAMELVGGTAPQLKLDSAEMPLSLLPAFLGLGVLLGGVGWLFNRTILFMLDWTAKTFGKAPFVPAMVVGAAVGALGSYIWSSQMAKQKQQMEAATQGTGVKVTQTADNQLKLEVPSDISFATGSAQLAPSLEPILNRFAQTLNENPKTTVRVVGHTDSTGNDAINDPLSVNRASSVRNYLAARGVASSRVSIDGRGAREPIADNNTEAGRARNRRVDIFVGEAAPT